MRYEFKGDGTNVGYTHYYPSGIEITDAGKSQTLRGKDRYNGKELQTQFGLNIYDYHARGFDGAVGRFWQPDPLAEKQPWVSPYIYCLNNPMKYIDPDGRFQLPSYTDDQLHDMGLERQDLERFTSIVANISNLVKDNPDALDAIINTTGLSAETIMSDLSFGNGPTVSIGASPLGAQGGKDGITIGPEVVKSLASISTGDIGNVEKLATQTLGTAMTLLHEYGHYGDQITNNGNNSGQFNPITGESDTKFFGGNNIERGAQPWSLTQTGHRGNDVTMFGFGVSFGLQGNGQFYRSQGSLSKLPEAAKIKNILRTLKVK